MVIGSRLLRRPRDRRRHAALEVARQPAADRRSRTAPSASRFSEYHTGYRAFSRRLAALDPVPAQLRRLRLRPGDLRPGRWRAARACVEIPIPTRYFREASSVDLRDEHPLRRARRSGVLGALPVDRRAAAGRCCAAPPATSAPSARSDARRPRRRARRGARRGGARAAHRLRRRHAGLRAASTTRVDYDVHARSIAQGDGFSKTLAYGRPTAFRPPGYPYFLAAVYHVVQGRPRAASTSASASRGSPRPSSGRAIVALVGRDRRCSCGAGRGRWSRSALGAIYMPLILVGGAVMSEPLFDVFMLASLAAALAYRRSPHRYRWALAAGVLGGLADPRRARNALDPARCRWRSPCGTAAAALVARARAARRARASPRC